MTTPEVGDVLGGKFRVERVLGTGGMGVVLAAFHLQLEQRVAIKLLQADAAKQKEVVARFAREARAAARIESEHVARVLDVGTMESGAPYMVMEYLHGDDLEAILRQKGQLPIVEVVGYVLQACEAIAEAHSMGIVHRDLKPANLFLAERTDGMRLIKVLDFGISKVVADSAQMADASLTKTSAVMGSPMYMSPEQLRSARDVDARADIWALGVTLYELFCGKGPFSTGTVPEVCAAILKDQPRPPREMRRELPEGLQSAVLRCLEKDARRRFANVAELSLALMSYAPRGSERSIERISRVLQRGARSLRGGAPTPTPTESGPGSEPRTERSRESLELALTTPSTSDLAIEDLLAQTNVERKVEPTPMPTDPGATASATSISSWDGKQTAVPRGGRSPAAFIVSGVLASLVIGGVVLALSGADEQPHAGEAAVPPSEATAPSLAAPPGPSEGPAIAEPASASPPESDPPAASADTPIARPREPIDPRRRMPWPKPRTGASASSGPSAEPSSGPSATPSAAPSAAATSAPSSAPTAKATASPTAKP